MHITFTTRPIYPLILLPARPQGLPKTSPEHRMILRQASLLLSAGLLAAGLTARAQVSAETPPQVVRPAGAPKPTATAGKPGDEIIESFKISEGDIDAVLGALEAYTGRSIIRPGTLPVATGGYTLRLNHIPKSELILALETLLSLNQIGVVPMGDHFLKVVPLSVTRAEAPDFIAVSTLDMQPSGRIATKIFQLEFLRANEFFSQGLTTLFTPGIGGGVVLLEKANAALITDTVSNLQRVELLIHSLDRPMLSGCTPKFYPLHYAKASDLVTKMKALLGSGAVQIQIGTATTYQADDRTNQVIVICDPREVPYFDELIGRLDVKSDPNTRNEVIYLKHADAKDLTTLLSAVVTGQNQAAQKSSTPSVRPGEVANIQPVATAAGTKEGAATNEFSSFMTIQPDERSNSVVVSGTVDDIRLIRELIEKLDIALAQVRIQVIIAEVTLTNSDISGITALGLTVGQQNGATHVTNFAGSSTGSTTTGTATTTAIPGTSISGWDFTSGVVNPLAFNAAFNSASTGTKNVIHVLQAPVIVTAHNKPAQVTVGQQVPIINGGQSTLATTGVSPVNSFSSTYQNVAIDLTVTPLIGENGDIQLTIDQKVDDIGSYITIQAGDTQPVIDHREMKSFVTVKDGQMIVLGGLQQAKKTTTQNKIGFLYEIPILSQILGGHTDQTDRTELLFFIRPEILSPTDGSADVRKRVEELSNRDQIKRFLADPGDQKPDSKVQNFIDRFKN